MRSITSESSRTITEVPCCPCSAKPFHLVSVPAANAADLPPIIHKAPAVVEEVGGGWYLRGDIGFSNQQVGSTKYDFGSLAGPTSVDTVSKGFETGGIFGIGLGYQFNSW